MMLKLNHETAPECLKILSDDQQKKLIEILTKHNIPLSDKVS
jgi:hypothetical protein